METSFCYSHRYKYGVGYKVERGCYSGTNNLTVCNELSRVRTSSNCLACTTETCNYQRILKTPGMSCYDCNDENQCFHPEQYSIPITTCSSENAVCFAFQAYPDGVKKAYRGCFNDGGTTSEVKEKLNEKYKNINISKLSVCEQSNCNSLQLPLECYTCGGVNNYGGCLDPSSNPDTQINKCEPKANMTQVCTSYYISDAKKVVRRCANVDKTVLDVCDLISNQFKGGSKITQCNYCSEDLCNKDIINGASFNGLSFYTLIVGFGAVLLTGRL
ncbi:uncharacterized protein LOC109603624 [Aethina tumida]|uniref:uncharacterized protein LOC109603624 n=1 Tax=Aethina tumida TaxID=116153 RepID=UPI002147CEE5|nr:uncharacterized protein LOC109603624 [Aethina tumida]